jgi:hypothetical protein
MASTGHRQTHTAEILLDKRRLRNGPPRILAANDRPTDTRSVAANHRPTGTSPNFSTQFLGSDITMLIECYVFGCQLLKLSTVQFAEFVLGKSALFAEFFEEH